MHEGILAACSRSPLGNSKINRRNRSHIKAAVRLLTILGRTPTKWRSSSYRLISVSQAGSVMIIKTRLATPSPSPMHRFVRSVATAEKLLAARLARGDCVFYTALVFQLYEATIGIALMEVAKGDAHELLRTLQRQQPILTQLNHRVCRPRFDVPGSVLKST